MTRTLTQKTRWRTKLKKRIRSFDAVALIRLLAKHGVDALRIRYRAHRTSAPQPTLLHDIHFHRGGQALVTLNLGLGSCRSPLPSYILAFLADPEIGGPFGRLLDFIDHKLVSDRLASFRPELDPRLVPVRGGGRSGWGATRLDMLRLASRTSPSRLQWIFQRVFPELDVGVRRARGSRRMDAPGVRLGSGEMGVAAFGGEAAVPVSGLEVTLFCDEPATYTGRPWTLEAPRRLAAQVFPILGETGVHLTVVLVVLERVAPARFEGPDGYRSYVSYNPLGPEADAPAAPARVVLFSGRVPVDATYRARGIENRGRS
jgi:hypothetical protein